MDPRIDQTVAHFCEIYLGGIPPIITNDSSFLSFICLLSAIEALAGFRFAHTETDPGKRFEGFIREYFAPEYHEFADGRWWTFRCRMVHAFSPAGFSLMHHHSEGHLRRGQNWKPLLNAEDFYAALVVAAQAYFRALRSDVTLQNAFIARLEDKHKGGALGVGPIGQP
jgi:hypothetical protein